MLVSNALLENTCCHWIISFVKQTVDFSPEMFSSFQIHSCRLHPRWTQLCQIRRKRVDEVARFTSLFREPMLAVYSHTSDVSASRELTMIPDHQLATNAVQGSGGDSPATSGALGNSAGWFLRFPASNFSLARLTSASSSTSRLM